MKQFLVAWRETLDPVEHIGVLFTDRFNEWKKMMEEKRGCFITIIVPLSREQAMEQNYQHIIF